MASPSETLDVISHSPIGIVIRRGRPAVKGYAAKVVIVRVGGRLVIRTAFVEGP